MAGLEGINDPLRFTFDEDMEDLTAHLDGAATGHHDPDLDDHAQLQGNLDRFKSLAGASDDDDDPLSGLHSLGGLPPRAPAPGPGLGPGSAGLEGTGPASPAGAAGQAPPAAPGPGARADPLGPLAGGSVGLPPHHDYPTYGQLAAMPPSYEDSIMYDAAPGGRTLAAGFQNLDLLSSDPLAAAGAPSGAPGGAAARSAAASPAGAQRGPGGAAAAQLPSPSTPAPAGARHSGAGASPITLQRQASMATGLTVTVTEPIKREQGGLFGIKGGYVTYLVKSHWTGAAAQAAGKSDAAVRRRFREFVALADLLKAKYRGYFVPPRPEKNAVESQRMTDTFVEERRQALERYASKLARHPIISASPELRVFLTAESELFDCPAWHALAPPGQGTIVEGTAKLSKQLLGLERSVMDPTEATRPTKKSADLLRAIKETAQRMHAGNGNGAALPEDEAALRQANDDLEVLAGSLTGASRAAERLVSRLDRCSAVNGELGLALFRVSKAEEEQGGHLAQHTGTVRQSGNLMYDTRRAGTALVRASRVLRKATGRSAIELEVLHDHLGMMPAALKGLRAREKALLTADTLAADLEAKQRAIGDLEVAGAKVLGGDQAKAKKVQDLRNDVAVLEQSIVAARANYDNIKAINKQELGRLQHDVKAEMRGMLHNFGAIMAATSQRNLEVWLQVADELGASREALQEVRASLGAGAGPGARAAAAAAGDALGPLSPATSTSMGGAAHGGGGGGTSSGGGAPPMVADLSDSPEARGTFK